jgi:hypothetical protein
MEIKAQEAVNALTKLLNEKENIIRGLSFMFTIVFAETVKTFIDIITL